MSEADVRIAKLEQRQESCESRLSAVEDTQKQITEIRDLLLVIQSDLQHEIKDFDDKRLRCMKEFDARYVQHSQLNSCVQKQIDSDREKRSETTSRSTLIFGRVLDIAFKLCVVLAAGYAVYSAAMGG
jgi:hypothetical protein